MAKRLSSSGAFGALNDMQFYLDDPDGSVREGAMSVLVDFFSILALAADQAVIRGDGERLACSDCLV